MNSEKDQADDQGWRLVAEVFGVLGPLCAGVGSGVGWVIGRSLEAATAGATVASCLALPLCAVVVVARLRGVSRRTSTTGAALVAGAMLVAAAGVALATAGGDPGAGAHGTPTPAAPTSSPPAPAVPSSVPGTPPPPSPTRPSPTPPEPPAGWPTDANDGSTAMWAYFGSEFFFPDWVSCAETYCLAGEGAQIHVYTRRPVKRTRTFKPGAGDPLAQLLGLGFTESESRALLKTA